MRIELEPAYLLHRRDYRESSLLLEVLTERHGRVGMIARGARRRGGFVAQLTPFRALSLNWTGRGELSTLTGVESVEVPLTLSGERLFSGFYVNEITLRVTSRNDPDPQLFAAYTAALKGLAAEGNQEAVLRIYEKHLLHACGYAMVLEAVADGRDAGVRAGADYDYVADVGPVPAGGRAGALPVSGRTLLALASECLDDEEVLREAKSLMRFLLRPHLGERPLYSRALFRQN